MKTDFYELFSLYTPEDEPDGDLGTESVKAAVVRGITGKTKKRRSGKALWAVAAAAAAAVLGLTVTAGAAGGIGFFRSLFGKNAEKIENFLLDPDSFEIVEESFADYDFTVTGLAADGHMIYLGLDVTALNGAELGWFSKTEYRPDTGDVICGYTGEWKNRDENGGSIFFKLTSYDIVSKGSFVIDGMYFSDFGSGYFGTYPSEYSGRFEIRFDLKEMSAVKLENIGEKNLPMLLFGESGFEEADVLWDITHMDVTGLSLYMEAQRPLDGYNVGSMPFDERKAYILLDDGSKVSITWAGSGGLEMENATGSHWLFSLSEPVDTGRIEAVVMGEDVINIKQ